MFDAGLSYSKLARHVKPSSVDAFFISHEHADHFKAVPELLRRGHRVYMSRGTARVTDSLGWELIDIRQKMISGWLVKGFPVVHDAEEPIGFFCESITTGKRIVYIADSGLVEYDFPGVTHYIIECNYLEEKLAAGDYPEVVKDRIRRNHFSLKSLKTFFRTSDMSQTEEIHLVHLSDANSDEAAFIDEIQRLTGCPTYGISEIMHQEALKRSDYSL